MLVTLYWIIVAVFLLLSWGRFSLLLSLVGALLWPLCFLLMLFGMLYTWWHPQPPPR